MARNSQFTLRFCTVSHHPVFPNINAYDDAQCGEADPAARAALRTKANEELAAMVRAETTDALNKVLFELSSGMKNAYSRSDA